MSIQSTLHISRNDAIKRINRICQLASNKDYKGVQNASFEPYDNVAEFVDTFVNLDGLEKWTNKMLEDVMDKPFFRQSYFDNYIVENGEY